jgi:F-type H+-transporting ATPase subunit gamma
MATLLALKSRIKTAKNVSKTTKAMQMIAASKLKRAQEATLSSRPYAQKLSVLSQNLLNKLPEENIHEYMKKNTNEEGKTLLVVFAPEKGLCGALNTNMVNELSRLNKDLLYIVTIGKKIESSVKFMQNTVIASFPLGTTIPQFSMVFPLLQIIDDYFLNRKVNKVQILFPKFTSLFTQSPKLETLLPIEISQDKIEESSSFTVFEPQPQDILPSLLRHYLEILIHQYLMETYLSEQGSRMLSMKNATDNAAEIIESLQLEYNKSRQEKITSELLNTGGATSLFAYE